MSQNLINYSYRISACPWQRAGSLPSHALNQKFQVNFYFLVVSLRPEYKRSINEPVQLHIKLRIQYRKKSGFTFLWAIL